MNTADFCRKVGIKKATLHAYLYLGIIKRPKTMHHSGLPGKPSFEWTEADVAAVKATMKKRAQRHGGRHGKPAKKPAPKATRSTRRPRPAHHKEHRVPAQAPAGVARPTTAPVVPEAPAPGVHTV